MVLYKEHLAKLPILQSLEYWTFLLELDNSYIVDGFSKPSPSSQLATYRIMKIIRGGKLLHLATTLLIFMELSWLYRPSNIY